jgi:conjugal transfer pilus assembly protein TraB
MCYYTLSEETKPLPTVRETTLPLDKTSPQELWMNRVEAERRSSEDRLNFLEGVVLESKSQQQTTLEENEKLKQDLAKLKYELSIVATEANKPKKQLETVVYANDPFSPSYSPVEKISTPRVPLKVVESDDVEETLYDVERVIPAGTSVRAILVSSVDIPCGVYSTSDPQPVKLRLIDDGHLPKKVRAKLKGGIIIASANGDLSNERIYIRLERLTQVRADGKFVETGVTGYVTGEDGKYGIKGIVVDKSYKMVENAAVSGFLGGINQYLQATATRGVNIYEPGYNINGRDMAVQGGSQGVNGAFDMLADYYIRRAEQIRPVIQATAGRRVDITFTCNAELGDLHTVEKVKRIRERSREES